MVKQTHQQNQENSQRNTLIVMAIGALLVAGLVGWALTRTVEAPVTTPVASTEQFPTTTVATTPSNTPQVTDTNAAGLSPAVGRNTPPVTGTNAITPVQEHSQSPDKAAVARISAEDLRERMRSGNVVVVDVRDANSFAQGHIAGAMHVPFATVEAQLASLPKGKEIVTYCT